MRKALLIASTCFLISLFMIIAAAGAVYAHETGDEHDEPTTQTSISDSRDGASSSGDRVLNSASSDTDLGAISSMDADASDEIDPIVNILEEQDEETASTDNIEMKLKVLDISGLKVKIQFTATDGLIHNIQDGQQIRYLITHLERDQIVYEETNPLNARKILTLELSDGERYEITTELLDANGNWEADLGEGVFGLVADHPSFEEKLPSMVVLFGASFLGLMGGVYLRKRRMVGKDTAGNDIRGKDLSGKSSKK